MCHRIGWFGKAAPGQARIACGFLHERIQCCYLSRGHRIQCCIVGEKSIIFGGKDISRQQTEECHCRALPILHDLDK